MEIRKGNTIINVDEAKLSNDARLLIELNAEVLNKIQERVSWTPAYQMYQEYTRALLANGFIIMGDNKGKGWSTGWHT